MPKRKMKEAERLFKLGYRKVDPTKERVMAYQEFKDACQSNFRAGTEQGFQAGYLEGKKKSRELAFGDMADLWTEVAKSHQTASSYAKTLADIHRAMGPKPNAEAKEEKK